MTTTATEIPVDRKDQYDQIRAGLLHGEKILAVYDAKGSGTGFIGLTDRRVILQDKSFTGGRLALTSLPYKKITSVSVISNKSLMGNVFGSGTLAVTAGSHTYEVEFRGPDKAKHAHNLILWYAAFN